MAGREAGNARAHVGYRRAEILAALANGARLVVLAVWIVVEAVRRLGSPAEVEGGTMLLVGAAGLAVDVAAARSSGGREARA